MAGEGQGTGTPQPGTGPQGNEGAGPKKKYLGKYDSLDDAVEKGIGGLEQGFHETRGELKAIRDLLELAVSPPGGAAPVGSRGDDRGRGDDYGRGAQAIEDTIDPAEWIATPGKALRRVNEVRERTLMNNIGNFVNQAVAGAMAVSDFKRENPDLIEHEHIVSHFMKNTDPRLPLDKRLRQAAKDTKAYLKSVRGDKQGDDDAGRSPNNDEFVENPAERSDQQNLNLKGNQDKENQDETLDEYISQRRKERQKHFAPPSRS